MIGVWIAAPPLGTPKVCPNPVCGPNPDAIGDDAGREKIRLSRLPPGGEGAIEPNDEPPIPGCAGANPVGGPIVVTGGELGATNEALGGGVGVTFGVPKDGGPIPPTLVPLPRPMPPKTPPLGVGA
jgi:hypothetical protein